MNDPAPTPSPSSASAPSCPTRPTPATFWSNVTDGRYSISEVDPRALGPGALLRPRPQGARARPTRRSAAGCATGSGTRSAGSLPIPPRVGDAMDDAQKWAVACTREALADYGWPERPLDLERTAVDPRQRDGRREALPDGAAHHLPRVRARARRRRRASPRCPPTCARRSPPSCTASVDALAARRSPRTRCRASSATASPAGSPTCSTCAGRTSSSTPPAPRRWRRSTPSIEGLVERRVRRGDHRRHRPQHGRRRRSSSSARSARCRRTGTRPYADGADGFVMGEGAALFVLKRLADAERDGDRIYAVVRGIGGVERRQGQGHHRAEPDRPAAGRRARLGERRAVARDVRR